MWSPLGFTPKLHCCSFCLWSYEIPLPRYKSLSRKLGALQLKSFASKLDQQRFVRNAGCLLLLNLRALDNFGLVCIFSCHVFEVSASSFIRDLGTRSFIILDVIWTCQFLPQWRPMEDWAPLSSRINVFEEPKRKSSSNGSNMRKTFLPRLCNELLKDKMW